MKAIWAETLTFILILLHRYDHNHDTGIALRPYRYMLA